VPFYIVVEKQTNRLTLRSFESPSRVLRTFHSITGAVLGDKQIEGDRRTPEGIYFVTREIPRPRLQKLHGAAAFELDYPNIVDRLAKKTGSGIWIHGVDNEKRLEKRFDTLGCVALGNADVVELGKMFQWKRTPVLVVDTEVPEQLGLESPEGPIGRRVQAWAQAWSAKDQDAYISFYGDRFSSKGMDRAAWDKYKRRLAKNYAKIDVKIENLRVLRHPKYSVTLFDQFYESDRYRAQSSKVLYWDGNGPDARIAAEIVAGEIAGPIELEEQRALPAPASKEPEEGEEGARISTSPSTASMGG